MQANQCNLYSITPLFLNIFLILKGYNVVNLKLREQVVTNFNHSANGEASSTTTASSNKKAKKSSPIDKLSEDLISLSKEIKKVAKDYGYNKKLEAEILGIDNFIKQVFASYTNNLPKQEIETFRTTKTNELNNKINPIVKDIASINRYVELKLSHPKVFNFMKSITSDYSVRLFQCVGSLAMTFAAFGLIAAAIANPWTAFSFIGLAVGFLALVIISDKASKYNNSLHEAEKDTEQLKENFSFISNKFTDSINFSCNNFKSSYEENNKSNKITSSPYGEKCQQSNAFEAANNNYKMLRIMRHYHKLHDLFFPVTPKFARTKINTQNDRYQTSP